MYLNLLLLPLPPLPLLPTLSSRHLLPPSPPASLVLHRGLGKAITAMGTWSALLNFVPEMKEVEKDAKETRTSVTVKTGLAAAAGSVRASAPGDDRAQVGGWWQAVSGPQRRGMIEHRWGAGGRQGQGLSTGG